MSDSSLSAPPEDMQPPVATKTAVNGKKRKADTAANATKVTKRTRKTTSTTQTDKEETREEKVVLEDEKGTTIKTTQKKSRKKKDENVSILAGFYTYTGVYTNRTRSLHWLRGPLAVSCALGLMSVPLEAYTTLSPICCISGKYAALEKCSR